ncbi:uncharacterized protein LOC106649641 isoform X12 [Trichogramma pretiosum]|uniref:uncharacterized protein LOC106649641 isoform X12 n=1 Tax=Trichogramma pretiosum TaxID=7493 RepID=UPI0006C9CA6C|nr:uncharacterized protein LOC106649641 isoform X12 [Trichogramma pretiosum]
MIDLERDTSERCNRKRTNGRKKSSTLASRRQSSFGLDALTTTTTTAAATAAATTAMTATSNNTLTSTLTSPLTDNVSKQQLQQHIASNAVAVTATTTTTSSSSSSASGRSEDVAQAQSSQMDDSGAEESPVYILTSSKGDRSYKLRDSRIIEIAGGREVFSQSRGKVAARKPRFLAASNSLNNTEGQTDNKVTLKKNNKSPNRQSVWELGSRCGEQRKQRVQREVTETVFSSEVHSVRRNPGKSILDYESPKRHTSHILSYDSILNSNNVEHNVTRPKSITDLEYGLPKNCLDSLNYPTSNHNTTPGRMNSRGLSLVNDGEVVVFDDIDDNWMSITATSLQQQHDEMLQSHSASLKTRTPPSSSACSTPSPGATYHRNSTDFFKMVQPTNDCDSTNDIVSLDQQLGNHKPITMGGGSRQLIGELPIAQYTNSPRRYGVRSDSNARLPTLLASPSSTSVYVAPRPGFPQRVLPTTPSQKEPKEISEVNNGDLILENNSTLSLSPIHQNNIAASPPPIDLSSSPQLLMNSLSFTPISTSPIACVRLGTREDDEDAEAEEEEDERDVDEEEAVDADGEEEEQREQPAALERRSDSPLKSFVLPSENNLSSLESLGGSTFDYLYEFSETRKVLEEFFKCPAPSEDKDSAETFPFQDLDYELRRQGGSAYVGQRLATVPPSTEEVLVHESPKKHKIDISQAEHENNFLDLSVGTGSSGDLGETEVGLQVGHSRNFTLSPETTECDSNCGDLDSEMSLMMMDNELMPASGLLGSVNDLGNNSDSLRIYTSMPVLEDGLSSGHASDTDNNNPTVILMKRQINEIDKEITQKTRNDLLATDTNDNSKDISLRLQNVSPELFITKKENSYDATSELQLDGLDPLVTPPPPAPQSRQSLGLMEQNNCLLMSGNGTGGGEVEAAIKDIRLTLQRTKTLPIVKSPHNEPPEPSVSPIWIPSLLDGRRRICNNESNSEDSTDAVRRKNDVDAELEAEEAADEEEADTDLETDRLLGQQRTDDQGFYDDKDKENKKKSRNKEGLLADPTVLIEGVLFRARYLGSTQLACEGQPTKSTRMCQAEEAVSRIKALAPDGESQPSTEVDLFISTEKIMVLNTDLKEIMMDHALRTISYIADIGDLVVLMARRRFVPHEMDEAPKNRTPKMICHVFESEEAQFIAQSIGQAFQVAYMEFLKANGIEDHSFVKEMDYQEVLNSQEIFGDELQMFAKKEMQKEVVVPKAKGEILGVVIVESGWGSMLPTVVIANLAPSGAAARCGQLNIGDQIIAINGVSLVGLPLSTCQTYIKNSKNQTVVKLTVVPCAPVVEVKIKRPDTKYQLGFSVQNGVICSLLRGGIAERGGVRVGHRIIEINNQSVVAVPHEKIVNLLATSVGEILMKTMPTSMFRLLTGQESPVYI